MLRGILGRLTGTARRRPTTRSAARPTTGRAGGTTANRDIERGARTLLRGFMRRR